MLSVADALTIVLQHARPLPPRAVAAEGALLGRVLAEDAISDLDMPPFTKAMMDGFAVRAADVVEGRAELAIIEEVMAGQTPQRTVGAGEATRIMTGAPLPDGADSVVMIERCQLHGGRVRIDDTQFAARHHVLPRGHEMRTGDVAVRAGTRLRPQEIGLLATVGQPLPKVIPWPMVGVLATGDELVDPGAQPGPGQIRNSNVAMLAAQVLRAGAEPASLGIARDNAEHLRAEIQHGFECSDVLLLSGGVSAGKLDLVPGVLASLGVQTLFHKVEMKPGKPILFGILPRPHETPKLVFGLPGNPVSSLIGFELFVRPALRKMMGRAPGPRFVEAALTADFAFQTNRPTYHPARLRLTAAGWQVAVVPWFGSADLRGVGPANAFTVIPVGAHAYRAGQTLSVLCLEDLDDDLFADTEVE